MKPKWRLLILPVFSFFAIVFAPLVLADAKSDYEFQFGQYRGSYAEYLVLKQDYLNTPSLDNQQKVMLSAKQTILARDLAKASLDWYLLDLIAAYKVNYPPLQPIIDVLNSSRQFFLDSAQKSQMIVTKEDLKKFSDDYKQKVTDNDSYMKFGIIAHKIAAQVRFQEDMRLALDALIPNLPTPLPANLAERIQELRSNHTVISSKIDLMSKELDIAEAIQESVNEIFFTSRIEKLAEIRTLQLDWINKLIDIDLNYGQI